MLTGLVEPDSGKHMSAICSLMYIHVHMHSIAVYCTVYCYSSLTQLYSRLQVMASFMALVSKETWMTSGVCWVCVLRLVYSLQLKARIHCAICCKVEVFL